MNELSDVAYVKLALGGDLAAFEALYARYSGSLLRALQAVVQDRATAEDLLQEVFVRAYRHLDRVDMSVDSLAPWLHRIALNLAYNRARRNKLLLPGLEFMANVLPSPRQGPERSVESAELQNAVWEGIQRLDDKYRVVVVLYYLQELPINEIADRLSLPVGTVKSRLYQARNLLRQALSDDRRLAHLIAYGTS